MTNYDNAGRKRDFKKEAIRQERRAKDQRKNGWEQRGEKLENRAKRFRKG